jgi:DinB superfamily
VAIVPDTKDWTWVLERACPECGLDTRQVEPTDIPALIRAHAAAWRALLNGAQPVRERPSPDVWSTLEYACHVRDVYRVFDRRLGLMLKQEAPLFPNWDQDATAVAERYGEQDPGTIAVELGDAAGVIADHLDGVVAGQWARTGYRSDAARFTVESFARYLLHDSVHHLYDVTHERWSAVSGYPDCSSPG